MQEKYYVIQWRVGERNKWENLAQQYATLDKAKKALAEKEKNKLPFTKYRIAEAYIVIRYKPVKF